MNDFTSGLDAVSPNCDVDGVSDEGEDVELTVGDDDYSEEGATAMGHRCNHQAKSKGSQPAYANLHPLQIMVPSLCQGPGN